MLSTEKQSIESSAFGNGSLAALARGIVQEVKQEMPKRHVCRVSRCGCVAPETSAASPQKKQCPDPTQQRQRSPRRTVAMPNASSQGRCLAISRKTKESVACTGSPRKRTLGSGSRPSIILDGLEQQPCDAELDLKPMSSPTEHELADSVLDKSKALLTCLSALSLDSVGETCDIEAATKTDGQTDGVRRESGESSMPIRSTSADLHILPEAKMGSEPDYIQVPYGFLKMVGELWAANQGQTSGSTSTRDGPSCTAAAHLPPPPEAGFREPLLASTEKGSNNVQSLSRCISSTSTNSTRTPSEIDSGSSIASQGDASGTQALTPAGTLVLPIQNDFCAPLQPMSPRQAMSPRHVVQLAASSPRCMPQVTRQQSLPSRLQLSVRHLSPRRCEPVIPLISTATSGPQRMHSVSSSQTVTVTTSTTASHGNGLTVTTNSRSSTNSNHTVLA